MVEIWLPKLLCCQLFFCHEFHVFFRRETDQDVAGPSLWLGVHGDALHFIAAARYPSNDNLLPELDFRSAIEAFNVCIKIGATSIRDKVANELRFVTLFSPS